MKPRTIAVGALVATAILIVLALSWSRFAGPAYRGKSASSWFELYRGGALTDQEDARDAFKALGEQGVPYLLSVLTRSDRSLITLYKKLCLKFPPTVQKMLGANSREKIDRSGAAYELLGAIRPSATALVPRLKPWLSRPDHPRYLLAILLLGTIGEGGSEAAVLLAQTLQSTNQDVRVISVASLQSLGAQAWPAVPALIRALNDRATQQRAIIALGNIGPAAKDAVPQLEQFLLANRYPAAAALHKINPLGNGLNFLIERIRDPTMSAAAIDQLGLLGSAGLPALDTLIEALRNDQGRDGGSKWLLIAEGVSRISPTNRAVIPILIDKLNSSEKQVRHNISSGSARMHGSMYLADERLALAQKLVRFDPAEPHGLAVLAETVETDTEPNRRMFAAYLLRQAGPGARAAVPALKAALKDKEKPVRQAAASALRKIEEDRSGN